MAFIMCIDIAVLYLPVAFFTAPHPAAMIEAGASRPSFILIATLAVFCTVGAFVLMNTWQRKLSATEAALIYTIEPVFAAGYALFLPAVLACFIGHECANETLTVNLVVGGGLILLANIAMQWRHDPHRTGIAPAP